MRKIFAWLGFRRFVPNCRLCSWMDICESESYCDAQGQIITGEVYGCNNCYRVYRNIDYVKE